MYSEKTREVMSDCDYKLCESDRKEISDMKLSEIGVEFDLPNWLLIRAIETLVITYGIGREKHYEELKDGRKNYGE